MARLATRRIGVPNARRTLAVTAAKRDAAAGEASGKQPAQQPSAAEPKAGSNPGEPIILNGTSPSGERLKRTSYRRRKKTTEELRAERAERKAEMDALSRRGRVRDLGSQGAARDLRVVLVDGYNAIMATRDLALLAGVRMQDARYALNRLAEAFGAAYGARVYVVYDAMGSSSSEDRIIRLGSYATAIFSSWSEADSYIGAAAEHWKRKGAEVMVISNDRYVRDLVRDDEYVVFCVDTAAWMDTAESATAGKVLATAPCGPWRAVGSVEAAAAAARRMALLEFHFGGSAGSSGDSGDDEEDSGKGDVLVGSDTLEAMLEHIAWEASDDDAEEVEALGHESSRLSYDEYDGYNGFAGRGGGGLRGAAGYSSDDDVDGTTPTPATARSVAAAGAEQHYAGGSGASASPAAGADSDGHGGEEARGGLQSTRKEAAGPAAAVGQGAIIADTAWVLSAVSVPAAASGEAAAVPQATLSTVTETADDAGMDAGEGDENDVDLPPCPVGVAERMKTTAEPSPPPGGKDGSESSAGDNSSLSHLAAASCKTGEERQHPLQLPPSQSPLSPPPLPATAPSGGAAPVGGLSSLLGRGTKSRLTGLVRRVTQNLD